MTAREADALLTGKPGDVIKPVKPIMVDLSAIEKSLDGILIDS
jgi:hypothetical protein